MNTAVEAPQSELIEMATAYWRSRFLYVTAQLSLADHLSDGSKTADELAHLSSTDAPALYRFMRTMAGLGLFSEDKAHRFSLTPVGNTLKADAPGSVRASVLSLNGRPLVGALDELLYSLQTGKCGFEKAFGMPMFKWLENHPDDASLFSATMVGFHGAEPVAVASSYDFSAFETIVDVGGATGNLLTTILSRYPGPRGILFDMPHVVRDAPALIEKSGLSNRISIQSGSFFNGICTGGDVYLLSHIIHDWNDDECSVILRNCRRVMKPASRVLIIEMVLPPGNAPHPGKLLDILMLAAMGGQERTELEYRALLEKTGFKYGRLVPTHSAVSIVEAFV